MGLEPSMGLEFQGDSASGFRFSSQGFGMGLPGLEICGTIDFCERGRGGLGIRHLPAVWLFIAAMQGFA